jgi:tetratricopeptide (TPR) repeat protein
MNYSVILLLACSCYSLSAQSIEARLQEGLRLESEFKPEEALKKYESVLQSDPDNVRALTHGSRMLSNRAGHATDAGIRTTSLRRAESYSVKAIRLDSLSTDAHFSLIVTQGLQAESAGSPREKIKNAKVIRKEAEIILRLDSSYALAYFVLGKWHHELSQLNWFERVACDLFFGGLPEGVSMDKAVVYFQQALRLEPNNILFLYGQAIALHYQRKDKEAILLLNRALKLPPNDPDDFIRRDKCVRLLKEIT